VTEILELQALHALVKHSSWTKTAQALELSRGELEQIVARLEQRLRVRLLEPDLEQVTLTEAGMAFHARTSQALDDLAKIEAALRQGTVKPSGKIRITAPVVLGQTYVAPLIRQLREVYPDLAVQLTLMDRFVDLVHENVDLAIRVGSSFDARLVAHRLCSNRRVLVASPQYLEERGAPQHPQDLTEHECILFTSFVNPQEWRVSGPDGVVTVPVSGMLSSNNGYVLNSMAEQGLGITFGATLSVAPALMAGRLVRVLHDYEMEQTEIFAAFPATDRLPTKVSAVVDFFAGHLTDPPAWDRQLAGKVPGF
jgi:DNA-binding transcriptional LysR family regulator